MSPLLRCLLFVAALGAAPSARADFDADWQVHDETAGPCHCAWAAPKKWRAPRTLRAGATEVRIKAAKGQFALHAIPAKQSAAAYVMNRLKNEHVPDCGDKPAPPTEIGGFQCGSGGGCNGQWEFSICAQVRPHPRGGQQLLVAELSGPDGGDTLGGEPALVAAAAKTIGLVARTGGTIKATPGGARAANTRGMRAYTAHDLPGAAAAFKEAIALDGNHVLAHYNLACVASLQRDAPLALQELEWLAASPLPDAPRRLLKGRSDPDLQFVRETEARARQLLGLAK